MDIFFCGAQTDLLIRAHTYTRVRALRALSCGLLMRMYPQATHYPPLTTLEPYDSDTRIDLDGLLSLVDIWLLLVSCITEHIFVFIGSALPLPYCLPTQRQHHCYHARVTKHLLDSDNPIVRPQRSRFTGASHALLLVCADHHQPTVDIAASDTISGSDQQQIPSLVHCTYFSRSLLRF